MKTMFTTLKIISFLLIFNFIIFNLKYLIKKYNYILIYFFVYIDIKLLNFIRLYFLNFIFYF